MLNDARVPPHDETAEQTVISACLLSPELLSEVRSIVEPEHLWSDANRHILEAVYAVDDAGRRVDMVSVRAELKNRDRLEQVGGAQKLVEITQATPAIANADQHAAAIVGLARLRRLISECNRVSAEAHAHQTGADDYVDTAIQSLNEAVLTRATVDTQIAPEFVPHVIEIIRKRRSEGVPCGNKTGLVELDRVLSGGLKPGSLYVLGGRPGMGKTSLALQVAANVARSGKASIFVSAEMPREQLVIRLLGLDARVTVSRVDGGSMSDDEMTRVMLAAEGTQESPGLRRLPLAIAYLPGATIQQIRSVVRRETGRLRAKFGSDLELGLISIDYVQLLDAQLGPNSSREREIGTLSGRCMRLAGELGCPTVLLSQLNRAVEQRPDKRPKLSDLRDSGSLEQDAYGIMLLYRDEYYNSNSPDKGICECDVAKHRNGSTGRVRLKYTPQYTRFDNLASEADDRWNEEVDDGVTDNCSDIFGGL